MSYSGGGCCKCCCSIISSLIGLLALLMLSTLKTSNPKCSIDYFYLPALNKSSDPTKLNTTVYLTLKLKNPNKDKGIYYDTLNLTLSYQSKLNTTKKGGIGDYQLIGDKPISGFYQGHKKKATRKVSVDPEGAVWEAVYRAFSNEKKVVFRVDLETAVRFKNLFWKTKRHKMKVRANVEVGDKGTKVNKKGIGLKSGAGRRRSYPALVVCVLMVLSV